MNGIPIGPILGQIVHHAEVAGGRSFVADFSKDGKVITVHHDNGGGDTVIGFSDVVEFAVPTVCGRAILCYLKKGGEVILNTITGQPWPGSLRRLRFVI